MLCEEYVQLHCDQKYRHLQFCRHLIPFKLSNEKFSTFPPYWEMIDNSYIQTVFPLQMLSLCHRQPQTVQEKREWCVIKKTGHTAATSESHQPLHKVTIKYYKVCNPATKQLKKMITFFIKIHSHTQTQHYKRTKWIKLSFPHNKFIPLQQQNSLAPTVTATFETFHCFHRCEVKHTLQIICKPNKAKGIICQLISGLFRCIFDLIKKKPKTKHKTDYKSSPELKAYLLLQKTCGRSQFSWVLQLLLLTCKIRLLMGMYRHQVYIFMISSP